MRGHPALVVEAIRRDVRCGLRRIRGEPAAAAAVILTLALTVGANAALFSLIRGVIERPLPVQSPGDLVGMSVLDARTGQKLAIYLPTFERLSQRQDVFDSISMYTGGGALRAEVGGVGVDGGVETGSPGYFEELGVHPLLGRFPTAAENSVTDAAEPYVVISYRFWQRYFSGDPHAVGQRITLEGVPVFVIGVMQPEFHGLYVDGGTDFWLSMDFVRAVAGDPSKPLLARTLVGRLRRGVSIQQAAAAMTAIWPSAVPATLPGALRASERDALTRGRIDLQPLSRGFSRLRQTYADPLQALIILTLLLLTIGCVNLSSLFLARLLARDREIVTQLALGASRGVLVRQIAVESVLLACGGAIGAWWVALRGSAVIAAFLWGGSTEPMALSLAPDSLVLVSTLAVVIACGVLVGVLPAWLTTGRRQDLNTASSSRGGQRHAKAGRLLLAGQIAVSLVLVACAGLFVRTLQRLRANDSALPANRVVLSRMWLKPGITRSTKFDAAYYHDLADQLTAIRSVEAVAYSVIFPWGF